MSGIGRLLVVLAFAGTVGLTAGPAQAAAPEWNPVRTHPIPLGPEANRLIVGFRATESNTVVQVVHSRARAQSVKIAQASTSRADVASLA